MLVYTVKAFDSEATKFYDLIAERDNPVEVWASLEGAMASVAADIKEMDDELEDDDAPTEEVLWTAALDEAMAKRHVDGQSQHTGHSWSFTSEVHVLTFVIQETTLQGGD